MLLALAEGFLNCLLTSLSHRVGQSFEQKGVTGQADDRVRGE